MAKVFVSYSSRDRNTVQTLVDDLQALGHQVWFDSETLKGGQVWWDEILEGIRECDVLLALLTPRYLASLPCRLEYSYADACERTVIPVKIDTGVEFNSLPSLLVKRQVVNCLGFDKAGLLRVAGAIASAPINVPLPDPLPDPPPVPVSPLLALREALEQPMSSAEQQAALLDKLRTFRRQAQYSAEATDLLRLMRKHPDLLLRYAEEIDGLLGTTPPFIAADEPAAAAEEPAQSSDDTDSETAHLIFKRPREFFGSGNDFDLLIDGTKIGRIPSNSAPTFMVQPGEHTVQLTYRNVITNVTHRSDVITLAVTAGQSVRLSCKFARWDSTDLILKREG
jgi:hypothetical protein